MANQIKVWSLCACCALAACASRTPSSSSIAATDLDKHILEASRRIEDAQAHLYVTGAFAAPEAKPDEKLGDEELITLAWRGDAEQLLIRLAQAKGLTFTEHGARMPLPVVLDIKGETFDRVLVRLQSQIGYRALIDQRDGRMTLHYNPPTI